MLNDMMQSLAPALYPVFRDQYSLTFFQTGIITFAFQVTASLLQPLIGIFTDRRPAPCALPFGDGLHAVRPGAARLRVQLSRCCWSRSR